jgi:hypothetical protein
MGEQVLTVGASRERIAAAGKAWHKVLGLQPSADLDDVKRSYRKLALLHHPDKADGDVETFRLVQEAYVVGVKKCRKRVSKPVEPEPTPRAANDQVSVKPTPETRTKPAKAKAKVVPAKKNKNHPFAIGQRVMFKGLAGRVDLNGSFGTITCWSPESGRWAVSLATACDGESVNVRSENIEAVPAEVQTTGSPLEPVFNHSKRDAAKADIQETTAKRRKSPTWLTSATAAPAVIRKAVDEWENSDLYDQKTSPDKIRAIEAEELVERLRLGSCVPVDVRETSDIKLGMQCAVRLTFSKMFFEPEEVGPIVANLQQNGKPLVLFSDTGGCHGTCGVVGAVLIDVFGFEESLVQRLEGGYEAWSRCLEAKVDLARAVEPLAMRMQRRRVAAAVAAGQDLSKDGQTLLEPFGSDTFAGLRAGGM